MCVVVRRSHAVCGERVCCSETLSLSCVCGERCVVVRRSRSHASVERCYETLYASVRGVL